MRSAFQIRLAQLEKRYQRQLKAAQQQLRNSTGGVAGSLALGVQLRSPGHRGNPRHRRSSWHSCLSDSDAEDVEPDQIQRSGSSQGFDSDCNMEESDSEAIGQSDKGVVSRDPHKLQGLAMSGKLRENVTPLRLQRTQSLGVQHALGGLKGGTRMWNFEVGNGARAGPQLPSVQATVEEEGEGEGERGREGLPPGARAPVDEGVGEHRTKLLQYFQQVHIHPHIIEIRHEIYIYRGMYDKAIALGVV